MEKELLKALGTETIYSAKGHFKAGDLRRNLITVTTWSCAILSVVGLIGIHPVIDKCASAFTLFGVIALLIWNEGEGKHYRAKHKEAAEAYLALHKEIRECFYLSDCSKEKIKEMNQMVIALDKSAKPEIPFMARKLAQRAIKKNYETDDWFL